MHQKDTTLRAPAPHFTEGVHRLFLSANTRAIAETLTGVFVTAFIWRFTGSFFVVATLTLVHFLVQPYVFLLNGVMLRYIHICFLFFIGSFLIGISPLAIIFFANSTNILTFAMLGALVALGDGLYWPNRNYLEFQQTVDGVRNHYYGSLQAFGWAAGTILQFLTGGFIALGALTNLYSTSTAYLIIFFTAFVLTIVSGTIVASGDYVSRAPAEIIRFSHERFFNARLLLNLSEG